MGTLSTLQNKAKFAVTGNSVGKIPVSIPAAILRRIPGGTADFSEKGFKYLSTQRGFLINSERLDEILIFQFNPTELSWSKQNTFGEFKYNGLSVQDDFFTSGGSKKVSFSLTFDFTMGALQITEYHKRLTQGFSLGDLTNPDNYTQVKYQIESLGGLSGKGMPLHTLRGFEYTNVGPTDVKFTEDGQYIVPAQFNSYPFLHFSFGYHYLPCFLSSLQIKETGFTSNLIPIKATAEVELTIHEMSTTTRDYYL